MCVQWNVVELAWHAAASTDLRKLLMLTVAGQCKDAVILRTCLTQC